MSSDGILTPSLETLMFRGYFLTVIVRLDGVETDYAADNPDMGDSISIMMKLTETMVFSWASRS